jgi:uncharacterized protein YndB with AHSA1/START domain
MVGTTSGTAVVTTPSDTQILITRSFDAPKHLVYRAWTTPSLIKRWWSGGKGEVTLAEVDLRVGGQWRYVMLAGGGFEVGFHGKFQEIVPDSLIVATEVYEGAPGSEGIVNTHTFTEESGRTTLTLLSDTGTREVRDMILESGMEEGMQQGWDLLEQIAVELQHG